MYLNEQLDRPMKFKHMRYIILIITILILSSCERIRNKTDKMIDKTKEVVSDKANSLTKKIIDEIREPIISDFNLYEKFPELKTEIYKVSDAVGLKCEYLPSFYKYYFTYKGDRDEIFKFINNIKCEYSEIKPDSTIINIKKIDFENQVKDLTEIEIKKAEFFYDYKNQNNDQIEYYKCTKTPEKHFIIYDTKTGQIYHMIENFIE